MTNTCVRNFPLLAQKKTHTSAAARRYIYDPFIAPALAAKARLMKRGWRVSHVSAAAHSHTLTGPSGWRLFDFSLKVWQHFPGASAKYDRLWRRNDTRPAAKSTTTTTHLFTWQLVHLPDDRPGHCQLRLRPCASTQRAAVIAVQLHTVSHTHGDFRCRTPLKKWSH